MEAMIKNPTIGADIEVFLQEKSTKEFVSAEPYIKGSKYEPFIWDVGNPYYAISLDNVAAEFCIPPAHDPNEWLASIKKSIDYISGEIPDTLCVAPIPAAILADRYLQSDSAKRFGCEPDHNVWIRGNNESPNALNKNLRSCGGHIHIGYDEPDVPISELIVKAMDLFVGIPSVILEPPNARKELYGKAGAFRFKEYGVEYRTVSNYYLQSERLTQWAYANTLAAINFINSGRIDELEGVKSQIQEAINSANEVIAGNLIRQFEIPMA